jgi:hypothetical protein
MAKLYPQALGPIFIASYDMQGYAGDIPTRLHTASPIEEEVRIKVTLRPTVSRSVNPGIKTSVWDQRPFFFFHFHRKYLQIFAVSSS